MSKNVVHLAAKRFGIQPEFRHFSIRLIWIHQHATVLDNSAVVNQGEHTGPALPLKANCASAQP